MEGYEECSDEEKYGDFWDGHRVYQMPIVCRKWQAVRRPHTFSPYIGISTQIMFSSQAEFLAYLWWITFSAQTLYNIPPWINYSPFRVTTMGFAIHSAQEPSTQLPFQSRPIPGPKSFNKELELKGDDTYPPAKVRKFVIH